VARISDMKIAMFTHPFAPVIGGIESSVATFAGDLRALGHDVLVVTSTRGTSTTQEPDLLRTEPLTDRDRLFPTLDAFGPDLIHTHQPFLLGRMAHDYARSRGLPLVFTHHTLYDRDDDRAALGEFADLERAARLLAIAYSDQCDAVIAPTGSIAAILQDEGISRTIHVVPTGIDTARFASGDGARFRERHGIPAGTFVAGHLGRLIPAKRVDFLADAIVAFLSGSPDSWALLCGEGGMSGEIRARFAVAGLIDRLVLLGRLPDEVIADAYAAMDAFTFASLTDTQGLVLLEAMAAGVPVLALRATGPQDFITDGVNGILLDPDATTIAFAAALAGFRDAPERSRLGAEARRSATVLDRRACTEALLEVYALVRKIRNRQPGGSPPDSLHDKVEAEWLRFADRPAASQALLPTRGFPSFADPV
jgi:1,2-diacylglycerol 3-alpha-glucosyltransferase